ncbi:MAG: hypothetical protein U0P30_13975 [Vicinamibacterales bacterium]
MATKFLTILAALVALGFTPTLTAQHHHGHGVIPHYNVSAPFGDGAVRTFATLTRPEGRGRRWPRPEQVGVEIPVAVMNSLPPTPLSVAIDFPLKASGTPFQFMMLDWNPDGHAPAGIYDKPHFDFHFYLQDYEDVMQIAAGPCSGVDCDVFEKATTPVPAKYLPPGFIDVGSVVPYMGNHLVDVTSPEFNGQPFTRTWIYGAYDGDVTFYEPMMTRQSLLDQPNQCSALKLPQAYAESGYYPTKVCTELDARRSVYRVFVTGFVYRQQS